MTKIVQIILLICLVSTGFSEIEPYLNPLVTEINTEEPHAELTPFKTGAEALKNASANDRKKLLNGNWAFEMVVGKHNIPVDFFQLDYDASEWGKIPVPSNWQRHGYGFPVYSNSTLDMEPDEVGLYRYEFNVPDNWNDGRTIIHFAGVKTAYHVYVNGEEVGYAEGAYLPSEFDITDFLHEGQNLLAVAVYRVADIQKIENFDTWRLSGIFRDVALLFRPNTYIEDFEITAKAINQYTDGQWGLSASIGNKSKRDVGNLTLAVQLRNAGDERVVSEEVVKVPTVRQGKTGTVSLNKLIRNVSLWSAEEPSLYKTVLELRNNKEVLEAIAVNTGFRTIEIIDEQIKVNGKKIYFKGVNRHDWHPDMARAISKDVIRKDIEMFKRYNINAVRTSHYPNDSYLYQLADEYGIYVMDEAAMETHWVTHPEKEEGWREAHLSRMQRMVERDKNHPSVILWSLGNEFHVGEHTNAMYDWVIERDRSRLVYYDGNSSKDLDIKPSGYRGPGDLIADAKDHRPVVMKEYMHAAGNEMGLFEYQWNVIRNPEYKNLHGGFIWDWKDQGWRIKREGESSYYDWGEDAGVAPTGNDGFDGITNTDMEETPKLLEVSKVFQDIKVEALDASKGKFRIVNRHSFLSLDKFWGQWKLKVNGTIAATNNLGKLNVDAGKSMEVSLDLTAYASKFGLTDDVQILFEFFSKEMMPPIPKGHLTAWDQHEVQVGGIEIRSFEGKGGVSLLKGDKSFTVKAGSSEFRFNCSLGRLISWKSKGVELLDRTQGPRLNLWRATTDADNSDWGGYQKRYYWPWRHLGIDDPEFLRHRVVGINVVEDGDEKVVFDVNMQLVTDHTIAKVDFRYSFFAKGSMVIGVNFMPGEEMKQLSGLPRLGLTMHFKDDFKQVEWYGRGSHENYRDRLASAQVGHYKSDVEDMFVAYVPAQANGNRAEVRWMTLQSNEVGVKVRRLSDLNFAGDLNRFFPGKGGLNSQSNPFFEFTALRFTEGELEVVTHKKDLPESDRVIVTIDSEHAGVASHPRPFRLSEHEVKPENKSFIFIFSE